MSSLFDWSATASSNTLCDGIGINTGMSPANVDNVFRSLMALVRNSFASALQTFLAGTAALPIANGGTGAITAPLALTALNALDASYRDLVRIDKSSSFTFSDSERANGIAWTGSSTGTATINPQGTTAYTNGAVFVIHNYGPAVLNIVRGSGVTLLVNGATASADAVLALKGTATLIKWGTDYWAVDGRGVS